jgi:hypothetical protein
VPHDDGTVGKSEDLLHGSSDTQRLIKTQPSFQNDRVTPSSALPRLSEGLSSAAARSC